MAGHSSDKLAVLIDADNAQASLVRELLTEIARYGTASVKRAYGDWTTQHLTSWKEHLHRFAIQPIQQFAYTTGKNATDSALIIDAMDLLHSGRFDGFCLVSSDSDFTRLATRIRESGLLVYGFGEEKTPRPFVAACDKFIYTEILRPSPETSQQAVSSQDAAKLRRTLEQAIEATARDNGWSPLSAVGGMVMKAHPSFDSRNYGYAKLGELVRNQDYLEVREITAGDTPGSVHLYVRLR